MRVVFIGASRFGSRCLEQLLVTDVVQVVGVVTAEAHFRISYASAGVVNVLHADVAALARNAGIPSLRLRESMSDPELLDSVVGWRPDAFVVVGWYHMIPESWRKVAVAYGLHASLLPDYSGGAPLVWAMINGESRTGITLFQMDGGVDSGPIVSQATEEIRPDDTIATLYQRIEQRGLELLASALPQMSAGTLALRPQPVEGRRVMPQRSPEDGRIDWTWNAAFIERWIRAQTRPYPGAFTDLDGSRLAVWRAAIGPKMKGLRAPGAVCRVSDGRYVVECGNGTVALHELGFRGQTLQGLELPGLFGEGGQLLGRP